MGARPPMDRAHEGGSHPAAGRVVRPDAGRAAQGGTVRPHGIATGEAHKGRNMVERVFNRMKHHRKAATRQTGPDETFPRRPPA